MDEERRAADAGKMEVLDLGEFDNEEKSTEAYRSSRRGEAEAATEGSRGRL